MPSAAKVFMNILDFVRKRVSTSLDMNGGVTQPEALSP